jgi:SAM-dependent methyltransferase
MQSVTGIGLADVQAVYSGAEGRLWELLMGEQIHIGGLRSSMALADAAGIAAGSQGIDLCCCTGAGMRFLVRFRNVARMQGVDATAEVIQQGRCRCEAAGLADRIAFTLADVCDSGLAAAGADFVWGEDAWCYVVDKPRLIAEAVRLVKPGGTIAFTDWVEGPAGLTAAEAERWLRFMKFPNLLDLDGYATLLRAQGCRVELATDSGLFAPCVDLYLKMIEMQLTYDALRIIGFDTAMMTGLAGELEFTQQLAHAGKIIQGRFVARKDE